jgi:hypothetical protein
MYKDGNQPQNLIDLKHKVSAEGPKDKSILSWKENQDLFPTMVALLHHRNGLRNSSGRGRTALPDEGL